MYSLCCCLLLLVCDSGDVHSYFLVVVVENKCVEEFVEETNQHDNKANLTQKMRRVVVVIIAISFNRWETIGIALMNGGEEEKESEVRIKK